MCVKIDQKDYTQRLNHEQAELKIDMTPIKLYFSISLIVRYWSYTHVRIGTCIYRVSHNQGKIVIILWKL